MKLTMPSRASMLLGAALLLLATSVPAQVLISNLANPTDGAYGGSPDSADDITTGTMPLTITRIDVEWATGLGGINRVGIFRNNAGIPSATQVGAFFTNPNPTAVGVMSYTGFVALAPNATYWVVVDIVDGSEVAYTFTNTFVANPGTGGASYPVGSAYGDDVAGTWTNDPAQLKFALAGALGGAAVPVPTLGEWSLLLLAALMAIVALTHRRRVRR